MITLKQIGVKYRSGSSETITLKPTSLVFKKGNFTVLLGASGAGKSTLLRSINQLVPPTEGSMEIDGLGDPIANNKTLRRHRRNTAMIFQQHQLIGRLSALENVLVGRLGFHNPARTLLPMPKTDKLFALECLERVGISDKALERVDNLSGGQQQRVGIARGLVQKPRILLADEPVASLDPKTSQKVLKLPHSICKEDGLTAVVSLHQVEYAKSFADRIIGLAAGEVVFDGAPEQLTDVMSHQLYQHDEDIDEHSTSSSNSSDSKFVTPESNISNGQPDVVSSY